jgi:uncharacterized membrane protein
MSFVVYNRLPEQVAVHWNIKGNPNWYLPKVAAGFGLPVFFAIINIIIQIFIYNDPKRENVSKAIKIIVVWIVPILSLILVPVMLFIAMGSQIPITLIALVLTGFILILCGNYLPKTKQNYVVGIKLPWTLDNTENWNRTHRMAGYLYVFCGIALIIASFVFNGKSFLLVLILSILTLMIIVPIFYSYFIYKSNQGKEKEE